MKKLMAMLCVVAMIVSFAPGVFAEDATSTITEVSGAVYQNTTATRDGVVWRFSDSVTGLVDTMGTSALTDDVFQEGTIVEPISYINEKGNVELSTADKETSYESGRGSTVPSNFRYSKNAILPSSTS